MPFKVCFIWACKMGEHTKFRLNIVFHKFLVPECYEELTESDIAAHIRFISVNPRLQGGVPPQYQEFVIEERSLLWYNPFMQHNRFCESSVFFHAWKNPDKFLQQPYVGFFHYDMIIKKEAIDYISRHIDAADLSGEQLVFAPYCHVARPHLAQIIPLEGWDRIVQIYNAIFRKSHAIGNILGMEIPLYHTFVVHREIFQRMMLFAEYAVPRLFDILGGDTRHLPFMIERLHGICLLLQRLDGVGGKWLTLPGVIHDDRLKDAWNKSSGA